MSLLLSSITYVFSSVEDKQRDRLRGVYFIYRPVLHREHGLVNTVLLHEMITELTILHIIHMLYVLYDQ